MWIPTSYSCALVLLSSGAVAIAICNALPVLWNDVMFAQWPYRRRENCAYAGSQSDESIGGCTDFDRLTARRILKLANQRAAPE